MRSSICMAVGLVIVLMLSMSLLAQECEHDDTHEKAAEAKGEAKKAPAEKKEVVNPMVVFETNYGDIALELFLKEAPISVDNFLGYVNDGFYDGTVFHRVAKGFVLQAGGMNEDMDQKKQKAPIKNEATNGLSNKRGTLSMARTSAINSATSHFFINLVDNTRLDHTGTAPPAYGYAVFGQVADDASMKVVDKIAQVPVGNKGGQQNVPVKPVTIKKARVIETAKKAEKTEEKEAEKKADEKIKKEAKKMQEDQ